MRVGRAAPMLSSAMRVKHSRRKRALAASSDARRPVIVRRGATTHVIRQVVARKRRAYPKPLSATVTRVMKANPRTDTRLEVGIRSALYARGLRFRKDRRIALPHSSTRADIVFVGLRIAIFIDGCFWHACPRHGSQPRHNAWYWGPKLLANRARDRASTRALRTDGCTVRRFWEHEPAAGVVDKIASAVAQARVRALRSSARSRDQ